MKHTETIETVARTNVQPIKPDWVRADKYYELTGIPSETVRHYKKKGWWQDGIQIATIANRLHVNVKEADAWITKQARNSRPA